MTHALTDDVDASPACCLHLGALPACCLAAGRRALCREATRAGPTARAYSCGALANNFYFLNFLHILMALGVKPANEDVNARNFLAFCLA